MEIGQRPWGQYEVLLDELTYKVKRITVLPGQRLSLQMHHRRAEHWTMVVGEADVTVGEDTFRLSPGEHARSQAPRGQPRHRAVGVHRSTKRHLHRGRRYRPLQRRLWPQQS
jgi:quercetin dioxygenase-like cupin family protein